MNIADNTKTERTTRMFKIVLSMLLALHIFCHLRIVAVNAAEFTIPSGDVAALIDAINTANGNGEDDTINLQGGIYSLTQKNNDINGPNGLPSITSNISLNGVTDNSTIIERNIDSPHIPLFRIFHVANTGNIQLESLTIQGGIAPFRVTHEQTETFNGGGLYNAGAVTMRNSTVSTNTAGNGGGIFNTGDITIENSTVETNQSLGYEDSSSFNTKGGGIYNDGGTVTVTNGTISDNAVGVYDGYGRGDGGGIYSKGGSVTLTSTTVSNNSLLAEDGDGGGIFNEGGLVTLTNSIIEKNDAEYSSYQTGGGIYNYTGTISVTSSTIARNRGFLGGGIHNSSGKVEIMSSTISSNSSESGGGILNDDTVLITNSTIAQNHSSTEGGAIENYGSMNIVNSTLAYNSADHGPGGIFNWYTGTVNLKNSILAENILSDGDRKPSNCEGTLTSLGNNIIGAGLCTILLESDITGDPRLGKFIDDGTPGYGHIPLLSDSPAIDAADEAACPGDDQLGRIRPVDGNNDGIVVCDIGAVEFGSKDKIISNILKGKVVLDQMWSAEFGGQFTGEFNTGDGLIIHDMYTVSDPDDNEYGLKHLYRLIDSEKNVFLLGRHWKRVKPGHHYLVFDKAGIPVDAAPGKAKLKADVFLLKTGKIIGRKWEAITIYIK
ncbi:MAG: hypothetical protein MRK01_05170 [Candidatus Scalindua sp.]|nr:hypothetical protein [Candidatus Scalindua sp.]